MMDYFRSNGVSWTLWGYDNGCCSIVNGSQPKSALISFLKPYMQKMAAAPTPTPTGTPTNPPTPTPRSGSLTLSPIGDTYVNSNQPTQNFGSADPLEATAYSFRSLMRFDTTQVLPAGAHLTAAKLRLYITRNDLGSGAIQVHPELASWAADTVTWNSQPTWDPTVLATSATPVAGSWLTIPLPLTAINQTNGNLVNATNLGLDYSVQNSATQFHSKEDATLGPQLILTYTTN
jgi:hypothetical protein